MLYVDRMTSTIYLLLYADYEEADKCGETNLQMVICFTQYLAFRNLEYNIEKASCRHRLVIINTAMSKSYTCTYTYLREANLTQRNVNSYEPQFYYMYLTLDTESINFRLSAQVWWVAKFRI